jgi:Zn-dependent membrane protease YugP
MNISKGIKIGFSIGLLIGTILSFLFIQGLMCTVCVTEYLTIIGIFLIPSIIIFSLIGLLIEFLISKFKK